MYLKRNLDFISKISIRFNIAHHPTLVHTWRPEQQFLVKETIIPFSILQDEAIEVAIEVAIVDAHHQEDLLGEVAGRLLYSLMYIIFIRNR